MPDDDLYDDDENEDGSEQDNTEPSWLQRLRKNDREYKALRRKEKEEYLPAVEKLTALETERRVTALSQVVTEVGGQPKWASLLPADLDPTPENVRAHFESLDLPLSTPPPPPQPNVQRAPVAVGNGQPPGVQPLTYEQHRAEMESGDNDRIFAAMERRRELGLAD